MEWLNDWRVCIDDDLKVLKSPEEFCKFDLDACLQIFLLEIRKKEDIM